MYCLWCAGHTERGGGWGWGGKGWRSIGIRAGRERGGTQWVRREGYHIFTGISSFKIFIRRSLTLYLFSAPPSRHGSLWSSAVWSDILRLSVCACVWQSKQCLHVQVCVHAGSWLSYEFINYNSLSFIQVLSVATQNTLPSSLPYFSLFPLRFCLHSSSPPQLTRRANTGFASKNKRL